MQAHLLEFSMEFRDPNTYITTLRNRPAVFCYCFQKKSSLNIRTTLHMSDKSQGQGTPILLLLF